MYEHIMHTYGRMGRPNADQELVHKYSSILHDTECMTYVIDNRVQVLCVHTLDHEIDALQQN